jgi:hypothetical protein
MEGDCVKSARELLTEKYTKSMPKCDGADLTPCVYSADACERG